MQLSLTGALGLAYGSTREARRVVALIDKEEGTPDQSILVLRRRAYSFQSEDIGLYRRASCIPTARLRKHCNYAMLEDTSCTECGRRLQCVQNTAAECWSLVHQSRWQSLLSIHLCCYATSHCFTLSVAYIFCRVHGFELCVCQAVCVSKS